MMPYSLVEHEGLVVDHLGGVFEGQGAGNGGVISHPLDLTPAAGVVFIASRPHDGHTSAARSERPVQSRRAAGWRAQGPAQPRESQ